jgi:hypothetical protein
MSYLCKLFNFRHKWTKYKYIIKLRLPEIQLLAVVPTQLKFSIVKDHDEPTIVPFETLFCMWECFNMGTELPAKVMLGQRLVLMQMTFLNNVRKVGRLVLSRTSCFNISSRAPKVLTIYFACYSVSWRIIIFRAHLSHLVLNSVPKFICTLLCNKFVANNSHPHLTMLVKELDNWCCT